MLACGHETYPPTHPRGNAPALTPVASVRPDSQRMASVPRRIQEPSPPCLPTVRDPTVGVVTFAFSPIPLVLVVNAFVPRGRLVSLRQSQRRHRTVSLLLRLLDDEVTRASHG